MADPQTAVQRIEEVLNDTADLWGEELDSRPVCTGFYMFSTFASASGENIALAMSSDGNGGEPNEWTVRGWLDYATTYELFGFDEGDDGEEA